MERLDFEGSTSQFELLRPGVVIKMPRKTWKENPQHATLDEENERALAIERRILEHLGNHPRIVPYLGIYEPSSIQLALASHGNLQTYIDDNERLDDSLRWKWVVQVIEPLVHLHRKGVIHSDLRLENYLVHSESLDLWLCDFGGSKCEELGLDGGHLPDDPFCDPEIFESVPATDVFSLGTIIYVILTSCWPFRDGRSPTGLERFSFSQEVRQRFIRGQYPDTSQLPGAKVIRGCWQHEYDTAQAVLDAVGEELGTLDLDFGRHDQLEYN